MTGNLFDSSDSPDSPSSWFTAHCDGGARGNPGPAGYGAVIVGPTGETVARLSKYLGKQTNNFAEYQGLIAVLTWANENGTKCLKVVSDSELMVNQMKGRYKVGSPSLRPLWEEAKRRAARLDRFEIAHTLRGGNKEADRLANIAMDQGQGTREQGNKGTASRRVGEPANHGSADQRVSESASQHDARVPPVPRTWGPGNAQPPSEPRQVLDGYVKDGVVHLLSGELPEGAFVKVIKE